MKTHKDLELYKIAIIFVAEIYACTSKFPKEEQFGITNQMRRAAVLYLQI
jgi:four helix bundle protein